MKSSVEPLCRQAGGSCAACCWGEGLGRAELTVRLRRQSRWFRRWFSSERPPSELRLFCFEIAARGGLDLVTALFLWVPGLGDWLRPRLQRRMACAFLGFDEGGETRVGCLLHPTRWQGADVRARVAFRGLRGFGCGAPDYFCLAAHWFARATWKDRRRFTRATAGLDWYDYSQAAAGFRPSLSHSHADVSSQERDGRAST